MKLSHPGAEVFVPDGTAIPQALERTTHLAISAHQDDLEIMAFHGALQGIGSAANWFTGVTVTNGGGSPRDGLYADYTDEQMQDVRRLEQKKAAAIGEYSAAVLLNHPSSAVKDPANADVPADLRAIVQATRPRVIYTHNLADKHDTHIAVTLRLIAVLRELPPGAQPEALYGCEVWRDLDWMIDEDKVALDVGSHENLAASLLGVFDSQICGGKRYDLATLGRRRAHATYHATHGTDETTGLTFAMDLLPLLKDPKLTPAAHVRAHVDRFAAEVAARLRKLQ